MLTHRAAVAGRAAAVSLTAAAVLMTACAPEAASSAVGPASGGPPAAQAPVSQAPSPASTATFDAARAWQHLERLVAIGPRPAGSKALQTARAYIVDALRSYGLSVQEQRFTAVTPAGRTEMTNLVVRIPGRRTDRILITGHYDTKTLPNARFVGASDGGSSAAFLVEAARALAQRPSEFTYELVWFDGEEATCLDWNQCGTPTAPDNTYGSRHFVATAVAAKTLSSVKAMILVDMIGARDQRLRRDALSTPWLTDLIWNTAGRLGASHVFLDAATPVEDDHMAFLAAGVPSVDIINLVDYPYWHTAEDTLDKLSPQSLQIVGDVIFAALPAIEAQLSR